MNIDFTFRDLDTIREALEFFMLTIKKEKRYYEEEKKYWLNECESTLEKVKKQFQIEHDSDPMHEGSFYTHSDKLNG